MARRANSLFTDRDLLTIEGRSIKHVGLIREYGTPNWKKKVSDEPISLMTMDIETNAETAELKLLGVWNGEKYSHYTENFLQALFSIIKHCDWGNKALGYWNKLDPTVLFKQFLLVVAPLSQERAMKRYGKVGGQWSRKGSGWVISPLVELRVTGTPYYFGIKQVIRSSTQFFIRKQGEEYLNTVWAYDIASLYKNRIEKEMLGDPDEFGNYPNARFPYYSKMGEEFHIVDWERFEHDHDFRVGVLKSNELDARACYDLGMYIQNQFYEAFKYYPRTLISTGSIARASIVATLMNKYYAMYPDDIKKAERCISNDVTHIGIIKHIDSWSKQVTEDQIKDFSCLCYEAYSGGRIDAYVYGFSKKGWYSDIASAYIYFISKLLNLKDSKLTTGAGVPPHIKNSYCLIRGDVNIPDDVGYHSLTIKHLTNLDTNIRAVGEYRASYTLNERDFLVERGATFENETWYNIETDGTLSPMAEVMIDLTKLRYKLLAEGNSAEYVVKKSSASGYGVLFEATNEYEENDQLDVERMGYRGGEFLNPLYATIITSEVRLMTAKAEASIVKNGGTPTLVMTDAVFWEGDADMIDPELVRDIKTLGYFESPVEIEDIAYLGTGRYSYTDSKKGKVTTKNRGLNISAIHDANGIEMDAYDWNDALKLAEKTNSFKIDVKVRSLVSVGMVLHNHSYSVKDLGLIDTVNREVDIVTGQTKRVLNEEIRDIKQITRGIIKTSPLYIGRGMFPNEDLMDQTLPKLRDEVMKQDFKSAKTKDRKNRSKASMKYATDNKESINETLRNKYQFCKDMGYSRNEAKRMSKWSWERILKKQSGEEE